LREGARRAAHLRILVAVGPAGRKLAGYRAPGDICEVRRWATVFAGLVAAVPSTAVAQLGASTGTGNNLNIEHYQPAPLGFVVAPRSSAMRWREYTVGLYLHYARNPLVLFADRLQIGEVVGHRVSADVVGQIGFFTWLDLTVSIPLTFYQNGDSGLPTGDFSAIGLRDMRLAPRFTLVRQDEGGPLGIAIVPEISLPIGNDDAFLGDGNFGFAPHVVADRSFDVLWGLRAGVSAGVRIRPRSEIGNIEIDDEVFYRVGAGVGLPNLFDAHPEAVAELGGVTRLDNLFDSREQNALIGRVGLRTGFDLDVGHRLVATTGVAVGLTRGYGAPDFQVWLGASYQKYLSDRDGDGIVDDDDQCPDDPEDKDGFEDLDGCPEPDNDKDGLPDVSDRCPDDPEDHDDFEDLDGCPDPDNDKDGIPDTKDQCPLDPEDFDGFEDEDGCPELDNDKDGIPDDEDKCPEEIETVNGVDDEDGCPDEGDANVEVTSEKVTINSRIEFDFDSARIRPESFSILNQVALTLLQNPQLTRVRVEGHTDERGSSSYNRDLSQRRAESVMKYLIRKRVEAKRLEAVGYGEDRPLLPGTGEAVWAKNRRVEFTILEQPGVEGGREIEIPTE
jgi:outer membrane protein OmpA-like peptidoglycan-associated protein